MPRPYTLTSVKPLKGMRSNVDRHALESGEFSSLINFNTNRAGYLEKRKGLFRNGTTVSSRQYGNTRFRTMLISRHMLTGNQFNQAIIWGCDSNSLWRTGTGVINGPFWTQVSTASLTGQMEWMFEYGAISAPYQIQLCRRNGQTIGIAPSTMTITAGAGPEGTFCIPYKNRMWVMNTLPATVGLESRLYFSDNSSFAIWSGPNAGFIDLEPGDGQALVSAIVYNDILYIFKTRSIWVLDASPDDPADWTPRKIHDSMGCAGRGTPQLVEGFLFFYTGEGIYRTDGTTFEEISEPLRDKFTAMTYRDREMILRGEAAYWDNKYIFNNGLAGINGLYVFDVVSETWTNWQFALATPRSLFGLLSYPDDTSDNLYVGSDSAASGEGGMVYRMNSHTEWYQDDTNITTPGTDANNFTCTANMGGLDDEMPAEYKRNFYTALDAKASISSQIRAIDATRIITSDYTKTFPDDNRRFVRFPGIGRYRTKQTNILESTAPGATAGACKIFSVNYADQVRDRAHKLSGNPV